MADEKRRYTVAGSGIGRKGGKYHGKTPQQAAKKAANQLFKHTQKTKVKFILREVTKGADADKKRHSYQAEKKNLKSPKTVSLKDGTEYKIHHSVHVKSCHLKDGEDM